MMVTIAGLRSNSLCRGLIADYFKTHFAKSIFNRPGTSACMISRWTHSLARMHRVKYPAFSDKCLTVRPFSQSASEHLDPQILEEYIQLKDFDSGELVEFFEFMSLYGYNIHHSAQMVIRYPDILSNYESTIPKTSEAWRNLGYEEKDVIRIIYRHPTLVLLPPSKLSKRYTFLTEFFSRKQILEGICNNVALIVDNQETLKAKIKYLIEKAGHRPESIVKSKVFSKSLHHIFVRHEILIRAGLYKVVEIQKLHKQSFYSNPYAPRDKYFSVSDIVCTSDEEFLKKCTDDLLSLNELVAFDEMLEYTEEMDELLDDDGKDKSDEEDNDSDSDGEFKSSSRKDSESFCNKKEGQEFYF